MKRVIVQLEFPMSGAHIWMNENGECASGE